MKPTQSFFGAKITLILVSSLLLIWAAAFYDLQRNRDIYLHEAEVKTLNHAQVFAEYSRSTLKRINEFILNARDEWNGDWQDFASHVRRAQENIDDIAFQVAIIDHDGLLAFSNLARPNDRTDLSEREHFRVHRDAPDSDRLFISRPLKGKVSGKWSIQVTRPLLRNGRFAGVLVVSISPDQFAAFAEKIGIGPGDAMTVVRNSGEIMARYPSGSDNAGIGIVLKDRPFLGDHPSLSGNYRQTSRVDGQERIWGYSALPEYGMIFVMGQNRSDALSPYDEHRTIVLFVATVVSLMATTLLFLLYRSHVAEEQVRLQLAEIFALSPDGYVSFDAHHRVSYISPSFLDMTGFSEDELVRLDEETFSARLAQRCIANARFPGVAALRQRLEAGVVDAPEARQQSVKEASRRHLIELATAGQRVLEVGLRTSQARTVSQILYFHDVTHETEVDRLKSEFLSTAAHELRTPMASIYGFTELMLHQEFSPPERREFLELIFQQSELMVSIINELLDLARIEARRGKDFNIERIDLAPLISEIVAGISPPPGRMRPLAIPPLEPIWVRADRKKLTQAVGNVLSNAYKYSPEGGEIKINLLPPHPIRSSTGEASLMCGIRIVDHGIGMTPEQLARSCERFYRADTSGKIPGTGLGMSIVKEIVELLNGSLHMESRSGEGTTVTLWLPAVTEDAQNG